MAHPGWFCSLLVCAAASAQTVTLVEGATTSATVVALDESNPNGPVTTVLQDVELLPVDNVFKYSLTGFAYSTGAIACLLDEPTGHYGENRVLALRVDGTGSHLWTTVVSSTLSEPLTATSPATRPLPETGSCSPSSPWHWRARKSSMSSPTPSGRTKP
mgnify:CR=1 FL=1